jgi:SNF2 family DNA or RNA helicase
MAILHGTWRFQPEGIADAGDPGIEQEGKQAAGAFFVWGEVWRSSFAGQELPADQPEDVIPEIPTYSLAMTIAELSVYLHALVQKQGLIFNPSLPNLFQPRDCVLALPADQVQGRWQPWASAPPPPETAAVYPWQVTGMALSPAIAVQFLTALPLGHSQENDSFLGGDLRFWSQVARWSLDLLVRSKFLPELRQLENGSWWADWQPLLDSAFDRARFKHFSAVLPTVCRMEQFCPQAWAETNPLGVAIALPPEPGAVLYQGLQQMMAAQIRATVDSEEIAVALRGGTEPAISEWLQGLVGKSCLGEGSNDQLQRLATGLQTWIGPLQILAQENAWRICFELSPPSLPGQNWLLEYFLQSIADPRILLPAEQIWSTATEQLVYQGKPLDRPQETLLMGLGLASRVYPPIEVSLQSARPQNYPLTPSQVYDFLRAAAWRLEDSGFGVILPPSLTEREGWANRLGLKIKAQASSLEKQSIGLASLLNFKWELSIGGQTLSKAQFDRLVALNSPLVDINGEWVELRPQDVKAAQSFFASRKNQPELCLEDALRLSTGDPLSIEKLPVVSFEATGPLQELLSTLTGNQTIVEVPNPPGFKGELRPYQARGVGWLTFLERWGLGACLADDMGLGKTIELIAFLLHLRGQASLTGPTLLICPTSVLGNWEREIKRFAPQLSTLVHHGGQRLQGKGFAKQALKRDLILTSYPLVFRDEATLSSVSWQNLVLDEAQNIKNPEARQSKAVRNLPAQFRIALTGTPVENRLSELWSILDFLNPGYLGPRNFFQRRFATPIERYGDTDSLNTLRSLVQPFVLRRLKTDRDIIQDLPEKQEMTVFCGLSLEQASLYEATVKESLEIIEAADGIQRRGIILATLTKLKQICNHPAQFLREPRFDSASPRSGKLQRLEEMLEEALSEGDRALVFTQFAEMGKLLQQHLTDKLGGEILFLYGSTSKAQRQVMVDRFQQDPPRAKDFYSLPQGRGGGVKLDSGQSCVSLRSLVESGGGKSGN